MSDEFKLPEHIIRQNANEKEFIKNVGDKMGYGRIMQLAQECWSDILKEEGFAGGEFRIGPCVAMTVSCGCKTGCDWCGGSRWLTEHVKTIKDKEQ